MVWYVTSNQLAQRTDPRDQAITSVLDVEFYTLGKKHGRASPCAAVFLGEKQSRFLEEKDATCAPFCPRAQSKGQLYSVQ